MSRNADRVREFYAAPRRGDADAGTIFSPEVEFHMPEALPHGGTIRGRDDLLAYFGDVMSRWDGFRAELDDLVDGDERVVALGRFCGTPLVGGRYVEVPFALVWTMRDGQAVRVDEHTDTALLLEALTPADPSTEPAEEG